MKPTDHQREFLRGRRETMIFLQQSTFQWMALFTFLAGGSVAYGNEIKCDHTNYLDYILDTEKTTHLIKQTKAGCKFSGQRNFYDRDFFSTDLRKADFKGVLLNNADFSGDSDIRQANFEGAYLRRANFSSADARKAIF